MKTGDKLYCIKDYYFEDKLCFIKDKEYEVSDDFMDGEIVMIGEICKMSFSYEEFDFFICSSEYDTGEVLSNYFVHKKEYRKLKIEKLYEIQKG